jgi:hypothetical protein
MLLGYAEIHGTGGPDSLRAFHGHAIYAGPDNDTITLSADTHAYLMGGDHNATAGWKEGRNPSAMFNTNYYLDAHPDVALAGMNPLHHYLNWSIEEAREITPAV